MATSSKNWGGKKHGLLSAMALDLNFALVTNKLLILEHVYPTLNPAFSSPIKVKCFRCTIFG
jgi:hypothetical protein